jgi:uncharacterized protein (TIGR02996 family)
MPTEAQLLAAVEANPEDDAPRLAHAEWLAKNGQRERAEFIRLQLRSDRLGWSPIESSEELRRINTLRRENEKRWLGKLPTHAGLSWRWVRGYPEEITYTSLTAFLARNKRVFGPLVRWVTFSGLRDLGKLADFPGLAGVRWMRVVQHYFYDADLRRLLESPHLSSLDGLAVSGAQLTVASLRLIGSSPKLAGLRELDLEGVRHEPFRLEELAEFIASSNLAGLRRLNLSSWGIDNEGAHALWARRWPALAGLWLNRNQIDADGLVGLGSGENFPVLEELSLSSNRLGDEGASALARARALTLLRFLNLGWNRVGKGGVEALAEAQHLAGLVRLNLNNNVIPDAGAEALAHSPHLGSLVGLRLSKNVIGDAGMAALGRSAALPRLESLEAGENPARLELITAVVERFRDRKPPLEEAALPARPTAVASGAPARGVGDADEDGLVRAILADPFDEVARLVYADWLDDHGCPDHAALMRRTDNAGRLRQCLERVRRGIQAEFIDVPIKTFEEDGLLLVRLPLRALLTKTFERDGPAWLRRHHIAWAAPQGETKDWAKLGDAPLTAHLRGLDLSMAKLRKGGLERLATGANLKGLASLDLAEAKMDFDALEKLGQSPNLPGLSHLDLRYLYIRTEGVRSLVSGPFASSLRHLQLSSVRFGDVAVAVLAQSPALSGLVTLRLQACSLGPQSVQSLVASPHLGRLRSLDLSFNHITDDCLRALSGSSLLRGLRWFRLALSRVCPSRASWLALAQALAPTTRLSVFKDMNEALLGALRDILGERLIVE